MNEEQIAAIVAKTVQEEMARYSASAVSGPATLISASAAPERPRGSVVGFHMLALATKFLAETRQDPQAKESWKRLQRKPEYAQYFAAMQATSPTAGGELVQDTLSDDVVELLRASSAVSRLNPQMVQMPTGSIRMAKITGGAVAYYVGEGRPPTVSALSTGSLQLSFKKLMVLCPVSNDLLRYAVSGADQVVRRDMIAAARNRQDLAFIRGDGSSNTPIGLRNLVPSAHVFSSAGSTHANIASDISLAEKRLLEANISLNMPGMICAPRPFTYAKSLLTTNGVKAFPGLSEGNIAAPTRDGLPKWEGYPLAVTSQQPVNLYSGSNKTDIFLLDAAEIVIGESVNMVIDVSTDGSYTDSSNTQQNAFANDETLLRVILEHDIQVRHAEAIAVIKDVAF